MALTQDPGHLLPADEWARVQADAGHVSGARPARQIASIAGGLPSVTAFIQCKYDGGAQPGPITFGVLHDAETPLTAGYARSIASYFTRNTNSTSAHFMVDPVDTVQMLATNRIGWHCGNGNTRSVGVEQAGYAAFTAAQWTTADGLRQMTRVAALIRDLHATNGIGMFWMTDQQLRDAYTGRIVGGWATHDQCSRVLGGSSHTDPTPAYPLKQLMDLANQGADMPLNDADKQLIHDAVWHGPGDTANAGNPAVWMADRIIGIDAKTNTLQAEVAALKAGTTVNVDATAVATALASNTTFLASLAKAVNDDAAARLKS